jgi:carboxyl-terminal processing protease
MMKKRYLLLAFVISLALVSFTPPAERYFEIAKNLDIFASLFKEVNALYVDEVNPNQLMRVGIDAMLNSLDPYTNFISEDEVEDYRTLNTGQYGGIGALTRQIEHRTVVSMVYEAYPAYKNGLRVGDEIIKMNDIELSKLSQDEANQLMRGQVGTTVKLSVKRLSADKLIDLEFKREKIKVSNVPYFGMITTTVGYVQLSDFTPDAGQEIKNAVVSLREKGAKNIILDLRGNPGGLLLEAVNICNIFIPKGKKVVSTKGKVEDSNFVYETKFNPIDTEIPLVVLINRGSASASEIVAGTIQDYDRGIVIGEKSYGKGLVQVSRPLSYNSQVKITTAKYYTPSGRCIQVLDYGHRREDGSVGSIPDSLKREFKTSNGRTVYDGGGIEPDIKVLSMEVSSLTQALFLKGFIFDYANLYASKNAAIAKADQFKLTDFEYQEFVTWVKSKNFKYQSSLDVQLAALAATSKKERSYGDLKPQFEQIEQTLLENKKNEFITFKDQVKGILEQEIAARYYLEKGKVEVGFKSDAEIKEAISLFAKPDQYAKILQNK